VTGTERLAAFILARLDEKEAAAKAAQLRFPGPWSRADAPGSPLPSAVSLYDSRDESFGVIRGSHAADHIVLHDPDRALREVDGARRLLELSGDADWLDGALDEEVARTAKPGEMTLGELIRRAMAAGWSDHPGYDPAWKAVP
jgi:Family of unknown function (DUF6221)